MGCKVVPIGNSVAILCSRGARSTKRYRWCIGTVNPQPVVALCDEPTSGTRTCDEPLCWIHRQRVGPDRDRCPDHRVAVPAQTSMFA